MKLSCFKCRSSSPAWQYNYTEPLLSILIEQEDRELQSEAEVCRRDNVRPSLPPSLPPSRASRATRSSSELCSRTFREPSVSGRAPGVGHAGSEAHKFARKGGCLPMHYMLWNIAPPPALILICDVVHLTGEMKCCRRQQQPNNSARRECQISARCRDISLMKGLGNWSWCRWVERYQFTPPWFKSNGSRGSTTTGVQANVCVCLCVTELVSRWISRETN